jgi:hypothetical protein
VVRRRDETAESLRFVGMQQTKAIELARMSEIKEVRVLDFETSRITVDFHPDRLDLLVRRSNGQGLLLLALKSASVQARWDGPTQRGR